MRNNKTKILLVLVLAFAAMGHGLAQKKGVYHSRKFEGLGPKDGTAYLGKMQYDEKSQFMYLVRNDDQKLYIDVIMSDRAAIQKTMAYGLTTWINPLGKKKKDLGVVFPEAGGRSDQGPGMRKGDMKDKGAMMAMAMQEKNSRMLLKGFPGLPPEKEINPMTGDGVRGKFEHLEGDKVRVALAVPLEMLGIKDKAAMQHPISIGFETGYLDLNRSGMASSSGMSGGGGGEHGHGGPPGGGPPSGGNMDQSGSRQQQQPNLNKMASPSKMWIKQVLLTVD